MIPLETSIPIVRPTAADDRPRSIKVDMNQRRRGSQSLGRTLIERLRARRTYVGAACLAVGLLIPLGAMAESRVVRWYHPDVSDVDGFLVLRGSAPNDTTDQQDVGVPTSTDGVFTYSVELLETPETYVTVVAYNADGQSLPSESKLFGTAPATPPSGGGNPPPPEPDPELTDGEPLFPPVSGALLAGDFSEPLSTAWVQTGANNSLAETSGLFDVRGVAGTNALSTTSDASNIHAHFVPSGSSSWTDYEVRGRFYVASSSGGVGVTLFSDYPNSDTYYRLRRVGAEGEDFTLSAHPDIATAMTCSAPSTGVVPTAGSWYLFRLRAQDTGSGSRIEAKVWRQGAGEPGSWQARCDDDRGVRRTSGNIGVWSMGAGLKAWDDLEIVPLDGAPAPATGPPPPPVLVQIVPVD